MSFNHKNNVCLKLHSLDVTIEAPSDNMFCTAVLNPFTWISPSLLCTYVLDSSSQTMVGYAMPTTRLYVHNSKVEVQNLV